MMYSARFWPDIRVKAKDLGEKALIFHFSGYSFINSWSCKGASRSTICHYSTSWPSWITCCKTSFFACFTFSLFFFSFTYDVQQYWNLSLFLLRCLHSNFCPYNCSNSPLSLVTWPYSSPCLTRAFVILIGLQLPFLS